ncbi:hypothetical protein [Inhella proteolytica]|uniref:Uncharacterized protein n=1 Tax=Inhella proteolytica TaxID=2795029 RepID=A0A931J5E8_9BURK|nr:hypothetical protein [Inhella proteolytica]MBH9578530.1 hypothetical protein [Inhella proteolytica]
MPFQRAPFFQLVLSVLLALLAESLHLGWEALHGGIVVHHLAQRADLPGLSNLWGLLIMPALAAWASSRLPRAGAPAWLGFALPLLLGLGLSLAFSQQAQALTEALFFLTLLLALLLPAHRPESVLGYVLGMSWTFGAVLPTLLGLLLAGLSWGLRGLVRQLWLRRGSPA